MSGAAGSAAGGGGDLFGGSDEERNKQLESLRSMFAAKAADATDDPNDAEETPRRLGLLHDLPLCRFSWCVLPHHQITLSIWQPQYTLMFGSLLAEPGPHYYMHVMLPGGAESLGQPGYELVPGTKASLVGTLMRVAFAQRKEDGTMALVVQGIARAVVLRATQDLPYSRGDVQILPDAEALRAAARTSEMALHNQLPLADIAPPAVFRRMVVAAAAAEAEAWFSYEALRLSIDAGGNLAPLNQLNASAAVTAHFDAEECILAAVADAPMPAEDAGDAVYEYEGSYTQAALDAAIATVASEGGDGEAPIADDELAQLCILETQVWLEVDDLLRVMRELATLAGTPQSVKIPTQLLGLLPPPPDGGWPDTFRLAKVARRMRVEYEREEAAAAEVGVEGALRAVSYVPVDELYPPRRRAERLSWVVWAVVGDQKVGVNAFGGSPFQPLLEVDGTAERLRHALIKTRELKRRLGDTGSYA